jgi:hypothetical protein
LQRKFLRRLPEWSRTRIFQVRSADNAVRPTLCIDLVTLEAWLRATEVEPRAHWDRATLRKLKLYLKEAATVTRGHFPVLADSTPFAEGWDRKAVPVSEVRDRRGPFVIPPPPEPCPSKGEILPLRAMAFHGETLLMGQDDAIADGAVVLPFKRFCDAIGVNHQSQERRLRRTVWATLYKRLQDSSTLK